MWFFLGVLLGCLTALWLLFLATWWEGDHLIAAVMIALLLGAGLALCMIEDMRP